MSDTPRHDGRSTAASSSGADHPAQGDGPTDDAVEHGGGEQVLAAARSRGMEPQRVRSDRLRDGDVQHVLVEPTPDPELGTRLVVGCFTVAALLGIVSVVAGFIPSPILLGTSLGAALMLVAAGLVFAATKLVPEELAVQERHEADGIRSEATSVEIAPALGRRSILGAGFAALAAVGAAVLVPIRGLGPSAGDTFRVTQWGSGGGAGPVRAVDDEGELVRAGEIPLFGFVTAFPEGEPGSYDGQAIVMRLRPELLSEETLALSAGDGLVAYSKVCTHSGCPIGQFAVDDRPPVTSYQLVCPCHQSAFDVTRQAAPDGGPATRPLAQLPIAVDEEGHVVALGDFNEPPGPAWTFR